MKFKKFKLLKLFKIFFGKFIFKHLQTLSNFKLPEIDGTWEVERFKPYYHKEDNAVFTRAVFTSKKQNSCLHDSRGPSQIYVHAWDDVVISIYYQWMNDNKLHRLDGPAYVEIDFYDRWFKPVCFERYYINHKFYTFRDFHLAVISYALSIDYVTATIVAKAILEDV